MVIGGAGRGGGRREPGGQKRRYLCSGEGNMYSIHNCVASTSARRVISTSILMQKWRKPRYLVLPTIYVKLVTVHRPDGVPGINGTDGR